MIFREDDSVAHIAEETSIAAHAAPIVIMVGVLGTKTLGWLMYIAVSFATYSVLDVLQLESTLLIGEVCSFKVVYHNAPGGYPLNPSHVSSEVHLVFVWMFSNC